MGVLGRIDRFLGKTLMRLFGLGFLIGGLTGAYHASQEIHLAWTAHTWPTAEGRILSSRVQGNARPMVDYVYEVDGHTFENNFIHAGQFSGLSGYANRIVERYPEGSEVQVYYDAASPNRALLEHRIPWVSLLLLSIAAVLLWAAYACFRSKRGMGEILASVDF